MQRALQETPAPRADGEAPHALRDSSMFAVAPPEPRKFALHDLISIVVHETSTARSSQSLEADKEYDLHGGIPRFPSFTLADLLDAQIKEGDSENQPRLDLTFDKGFNGDGEYERRDDFSDRITAEVIDILPNGHLVVEARRTIRTDDEEAALLLTGICRPEDVSAANSILSNQLHDLTIEKKHEGELKRTSEKGILAKVLDAIFAF